MTEEASRQVKETIAAQTKALRSGNKTAILNTVAEIRTTGHASILPVVIEVMAGQDDEEILQSCASLLNDLKSEEAPALLAEALSKPEYASIHHLLAAACWQNGLNYAPYTDLFLKIALEGSFETSIEAFTVLEECVGELELASRQELAQKLKLALLEAPEEKKALLHELYRVIDRFQDPMQFTLDTEPDD